MDLAYISGNWVDLVIIVFLFVFIISSIERGFLINIIDLLSFVVSFIIALKFYPLAAYIILLNFSLPKGIANALGFILLGFVAETIFFILIRLVYKYIPSEIKHSTFNKILGPLPALVNGLIVVAFFLSVLVTAPIQPRVKKAVFDSRIASPLVSKTQSFERELSSVFGDAVLETLSFITIPPQSGESVDLHFAYLDPTIDEISERTMFELVNNERRKRGLKTLSSDNQLKNVAREHGKDMFVRGYFSHINPDGESPFDRIERHKISFFAAGENLAFAPTIELAHQGLMDSPGHRANILSSDFGKVGIGVMDGGIYGKMFVQVFTD